MAGRLDGKVALISGGARGQGAAAARLFVREGARVVVGDRLDEEGERLVAELDGAARYVRLDVREEDDWRHAVAEAERELGGLHVLVNNAGVTRAKGVEQTSARDWDLVTGVNQKGVWLGMRAALPAFRTGGGGAIVNISSIYGIVGTQSSTAYHASKAAVRALTRQAAVELAPLGIRVNCVLPGVIDTPMLSDIREDWLRSLLERTPMRRVGQAGEVATAVLFLASDEASFVTGAELAVDGGYTAG
jgi:3alpha(or 20beta)-hydroxysteroid dehydrogenase